MTEAQEVSPSIELSWSKDVVPMEALERALYALADQLTGTISSDESVWRTTIYPRAISANLNSLGHSFRQEVNDQALRVKIAEKTDPIRNLVFALAFSRTGLVENRDGQ